MREIVPTFKVRQVGDAISASHLCTGVTPPPCCPPPPTLLPPHPDVQPDNSPSECYLLQKESALIAHTCDPRPHKSICPISVGTPPPPLSASTPHPPTPTAALNGNQVPLMGEKCRTNCLCFSRYRDPHGGIMRSDPADAGSQTKNGSTITN